MPAGVGRCGPLWKLPSLRMLTQLGLTPKPAPPTPPPRQRKLSRVLSSPALETGHLSATRQVRAGPPVHVLREHLLSTCVSGPAQDSCGSRPRECPSQGLTLGSCTSPHTVTCVC